jgi:RNA polymerase sigma factor (TIGR02999 family)
MPFDTTAVRALLSRSRSGDQAATDNLAPLVYSQLHRLATRCLTKEARNHTLQPTALVHEVYIRLVEADVECHDRVHFSVLAAKIMRHILVDHARKRVRQKRGGSFETLSLEGIAVADTKQGIEVLELHEALDRLARLSQRQADVIELHYFGGLSYDEIAESMKISPATVHRDLQMGKAWLHDRLSSG